MMHVGIPIIHLLPRIMSTIILLLIVNSNITRANIIDRYKVQYRALPGSKTKILTRK